MIVETEAPFKITVYNKSLQRKAIVSTPISLRVIPRHNLKGTAVFELALDHPALGDLMEAGSRIVIDYRGRQVFSGPVIERSINGPTISGRATFAAEDDFRILHTTLGWQVPTQPITNQGAAEFDVVTGPAETVFKNLVRRNAKDRLGLNLTIAPDLGRGATITVEIRMQSLFEKLFPAVEAAGLGVTVAQGTSSLVVDVYEPTPYAPVLSEESGIVQSWSWTNSAPKATNIILGGRGEEAEREFRLYTDADAAALWGMTSERFESASSIGAELNNWYNRQEQAMEKAARTGASYEEASSKHDVLSMGAIAAKNAKNGVIGSYPPASTEYSEALSDYNTAVATASASLAQRNTQLANKEAALQELADINAEYGALRAEYEHLMTKEAEEKMAEQTETTGIRMVLSETDAFRYGDAVSVGDRVSMKVGPGLVLTDILREAELSWTFENGVTATPSVGDITDNPDRAFAKALRNSVTRIRKIEVK